MEGNQKISNNFLAASILVAAILISGALIYSTGLKSAKPQTANVKESTETTGKPQVGDSVILGDPNAPVSIFVFSDFQCPYCARFYQTAEKQIIQNYVETNKAKLIYKDIAFLGPESTAAAEAADCAKKQGKYSDFHDALFDTEIAEAKTNPNTENSGNLNRDTFAKIASDLKINTNDFLACYDSNKYATAVANAMAEAQAVIPQISTPTIFINGQMIQGAYPYSAFSTAIDAALKK